MRVTEFRSLHATLAGLLIGLAGCRSIYYDAMEKFGYEKRDLLRSAVKAARGEQEDAGKEFKDALTQLQSVYGSSSSKLEKSYSRLKAEYDSCESETTAVKGRIDEMDRVASDLFAEWQKEISEMSDSSLASTSRARLGETRSRFASVSGALHRSYETMQPVLGKLRDHVLFLKHNLNAEAIGSLRAKADVIQGDIGTLLGRMSQAIAEADAFVKTLK
jgi:chromosome segregation ATPase